MSDETQKDTEMHHQEQIPSITGKVGTNAGQRNIRPEPIQETQTWSASISQLIAVMVFTKFPNIFSVFPNVMLGFLFNFNRQGGLRFSDLVIAIFFLMQPDGSKFWRRG